MHRVLLCCTPQALEQARADAPRAQLRRGHGSLLLAGRDRDSTTVVDLTQGVETHAPWLREPQADNLAAPHTRGD